MNTTYFLNQIMGNVFNTKTTPPLSANYYLGLSTTEPQIDGSNATEPPTSANYARIKLETLSEPTNGIITNTAAISFEESTATWGAITYFLIYDSLSAGNLLMYGSFSKTYHTESESIFTIKPGSLSLRLNNPT